MNALLLAALLAAHSAPTRAVIAPAPSPKDSVQYRLRYDHKALRTPDQTFSIGIITRSAKGDSTKTKGYLQGGQGWTKYKVEVQGGSFSNGKIRIAKSSGYQKGDSLTISVYTRKWFLGGKDKFLLARKIPYNYEDSISLLTTGNIGRAPGDHVQFGVRTWYDNHQFKDQWATAKQKLNGFTFRFDGVHRSKSKADLTIEADPDKIQNDRVGLTAMLASDTAIRDSLFITLNYIAAYQCKVASSGSGHDLNVNAGVYDDSLIGARLLRVDIYDSVAKKTYHYKVNSNGGSISISSSGANGLDGRNGLDGASGSNGSDGTISVDVETTTASDGTTQTTTNETQGSGSDGEKGGDGEDGEDGDNGGNGGNIFIHYSPGVTPFLSLIKAISVPGNGGSGGRGGDGGIGGSGGMGNPPGNSGLNGNSGRNGFDGAAGNKGKVVFTLNP
jgi:hypothetical protein